MKDLARRFFQLFGILAVVAPIWGGGCEQLSPEEACKQGDPMQCEFLIKKSKPEVDKMEAACERGDVERCEELAALYWIGGGMVGQNKSLNRMIVGKLEKRKGTTLRVGQNKMKSKELYDRVCQAGRVSSCLSMAYISLMAEHSQEGALKYYAMACDLGEEQGCYWVDQAAQGYPDIAKQRADDERFQAIMDQQKGSNKPGRLRLRPRGR